MNLDLLIKKNHIFKKRKNYRRNLFNIKKKKVKGVFTIKQFRFELVYFRFIKKVLKRKYIRRNMLFSKSKYWVYIIPNFILTMKSKNARMGAGVGKYVRLCSIIKPGRYIIKLKDYSTKFIKNLKHFLYKKIHIKFGIYTKNLILYVFSE